jgi:hypothetical protein
VHLADALGSWLRRLRYDVRMRVSEHPALYLPLARWRYSGRDVEDRVVGSDTELVIDGFEGSGNTFAAVAFKLAQPRPVRVVHNLHASAQVMGATRLGIPTLVVVRNPEDSAVSHAIRHPGVSITRALGNWIRYYDCVLRCRDEILVADFTVVTSDFGSVTRAVNERFDTRFAEFEHTAANVARCFQIIERRHETRRGKVDARTMPKPVSGKDHLKRALREELSGERLAELRSRAHRVYQEMRASGPAHLVAGS